MAKVKVFVHATNTDDRAMTLAPRTYMSRLAKKGTRIRKSHFLSAVPSIVGCAKKTFQWKTIKGNLKMHLQVGTLNTRGLIVMVIHFCTWRIFSFKCPKEGQSDDNFPHISSVNTINAETKHNMDFHIGKRTVYKNWFGTTKCRKPGGSHTWHVDIRLLYTCNCIQFWICQVLVLPI